MAGTGKLEYRPAQCCGTCYEMYVHELYPRHCDKCGPVSVCYVCNDWTPERDDCPEDDA